MTLTRSSIISAPGKIIFSGEHAVVHGSAAIALAIELRTIVALSHRESKGRFLDVRLSQFNYRCKFDLEKFNLNSSFSKDSLNIDLELVSTINTYIESETDKTTPSILKKGLLSILYLYALIVSNDHLGTLKLTIDSQIPVGQGLGSSASFCVCLATCFLHYSHAIDVYKSYGLSKDELNLVNKYAFIGEECCHGKASGIDNTISTFGNAIYFKKNHPIEHLENIPALPFMIVDTKVPKSTAINVGKVAEALNHDPIGITAIFHKISDITDKIKALLVSDGQVYNTDVYRNLASCMKDNQIMLSQLGVSHPKIDLIVDLTASMAVGTSKLTGGGGGGCTITLINPNSEQKSIENLEKELEKNGFQFLYAKLSLQGVTSYCDESMSISDNRTLLDLLNDKSRWH